MGVCATKPRRYLKNIFSSGTNIQSSNNFFFCLLWRMPCSVPACTARVISVYKLPGIHRGCVANTEMITNKAMRFQVYLNKRNKEVKRLLYVWLLYMALPFHSTHDLYLPVARERQPCSYFARICDLQAKPGDLWNTTDNAAPFCPSFLLDILRHPMLLKGQLAS